MATYKKGLTARPDGETPAIENDVLSASSLDTKDNSSTSETPAATKAAEKGRHWWYVAYPQETEYKTWYEAHKDEADGNGELPVEYDGSDGWGQLPDDWIEQLRQTGLTFCVSTMHTRDTAYDEDGKPHVKKPHYHIIVSWGNTTTRASAEALCKMLGDCPKPQKLSSVKGAYRYAQHLDDADKYQYEEPPKAYNGWALPLDDADVRQTLEEIHRLIYLQDIREYGELITECAAMGDPYRDVSLSHTMVCKALCDSYRHSPVRTLSRFINRFGESFDVKTREELESRLKELRAFEEEARRNGTNIRR